MVKSFLNNPNVSRGLRANNVGNLVKSAKWIGEIENPNEVRFESFVNVIYGIRALMINNVTQITRGYNTPRKFITRYAPTFENNTDNYINNVCKELGITKDTVMKNNKETHVSLAKAIFKMENKKENHSLLNDSDFNLAFSIIHDTKVNPKLSGGIIDKLLSSPVIPVLLFFFTFYTITTIK